jgi:ribose transport system ATP-binding protein
MWGYMGKMSEDVISMKNISKSFPGVKALSDVSFTVKRGEIHALVGENGAGKSTLIKILMGAYEKDTGEIYVNGEKVDIKNPFIAKKLGLSAVYQDITLARHLSVGENFFLGKLPLKNKIIVDWKRINSIAYETLKKLNIDIDPTIKLKNLSIAKQEMVSVAKAVHDKANLIIFDEPTALLANEDTEELFKIIKRLKAEGIGIIYISHRLEEIFKICDIVTVLKDGMFVNTMRVSQTNQDELISMMVGRSMTDMYSINHLEPQETVMEVKNITKNKVFSDISFDLHRGEILGMFGLVGSGRSDIVRSIFGAERFDSGEVFVNRKKQFIKKPSDAIKLGIGLLPEDRKNQGLAQPLSVRINTNLASYKDISTWSVISSKKELSRALKYCKELNIKTPSVEQKVRNLSGGNQQKVVISKWLCRNSNIFIFDEPTVGIDVGAKGEIYKLFEKLLAEGAAIIIISSYLPEVLGLADRIIVISEGKLTGIVDKHEANEERILRLASGIVN